MSKGITYAQAIIAQDLQCVVSYISDDLKCGGLGTGVIIAAGKNHSTIKPTRREKRERIPNGRIRLTSHVTQQILQEYNRRLEAPPVPVHAAIATLTAQAAPEARNTPHVIRQVEKPMPPEVAPRPVKAEPIHILPATPPPEPGQGAFMAIAARMDLAARRVEEREQAVKQAGRDLLAAQQLHDEAVAAVKEAKSDLERLGTEFSQRYTGLVRG